MNRARRVSRTFMFHFASRDISCKPQRLRGFGQPDPHRAEDRKCDRNDRHTARSAKHRQRVQTLRFEALGRLPLPRPALYGQIQHPDQTHRPLTHRTDRGRHPAARTKIPRPLPTRRQTAAAKDGLEGEIDRRAFLLCSFRRVEKLALMGRCAVQVP